MRGWLLVMLAACGDSHAGLDAPSTDQAAILIARYPLDHLQGGVINDVANGHDATCTTCPVLETGKFVLAAHFTSADQTFAVPPAAAFDDISRGISVAAWLQADASTTGGCVLMKGASWSLCLDAARHVQFAAISGGAPLPVGEWHHVVGIFDGTQQRLVIDGTEVARRAEQVLDDTAGLVIGAGYTGFVDEPHIFSGVLTADEIAALQAP